MQRPHISTNLAISADGKISSAKGIPSGWTSKADHARLLELRQNTEALLVGRGTLESDRMTMTVPGKTHQPLRCVVSRDGKFDFTHPLFQKPGGAIHLLTTGNLPPETQGCLFDEVTFHHQSLPDFLETLALQHAVKSLHCEGGGQLIRALADLDAIDEFHLTVAGHTLFGGLRAPTGMGLPAEFLDATRHFRISHFDAQPDVGECFLSYTRDRAAIQ
jgi:riboflavin biosynthesis pyrimidine reductase